MIPVQYFVHLALVTRDYYVNPEIVVRILFSQIALKYIFAALKIRDLGMIYLYQ